MLSSVDISRIVEVDRLRLRPNGIKMTEEELVALAYEIRDGANMRPRSSGEVAVNWKLTRNSLGSN